MKNKCLDVSSLILFQMHVWSLEKAPVMVLLLVGSSEEQVYPDTSEESGSGNKLENKWAVQLGNISD